MDRFPYFRFPRFVMVQTTTRCNASCIFCPHPVVTRGVAHQEMSTSLFIKLMRECGRHDELQGLMLFLMNEPLADRRIVELIGHARAANRSAKILLVTNGCALDTHMSRALVGSHLTHITISIHAHWPRTYQRLTGRRDFEQVRRNIVQFVRDRNDRRPSLSVDIRLIGAHQFLDMDEIAEAEAYWREFDVSSVEVLLGHTNRAGNLPGTYQVFHPRLGGCKDGMPYHMAAVLASGDVVLCCMDWRHETVMGNIREQSLFDIWHSEQRETMMRRVDGHAPSETDFLCKRCTDARPDTSDS